jgi:hypothetical protein
VEQSVNVEITTTIIPKFVLKWQDMRKYEEIDMRLSVVKPLHDKLACQKTQTIEREN